jgi:predicted branched-subunit amino acid permease
MCVPAYVASRRRGDESRWLLFASLPSIVVWVSLTGIGYGAQSLSNIIEVFWLIAASIVLCYLKVFLLDRKIRKPAKTTYYMMGALTLAAILLRTFMPVLPE